ncbi:ArsR/SmtB family transcription factor [Cytobacillus oceanisediminis]|uniref:ArsR/SmtB family transcription factor n=1 Tax=Cytobacillus oceanisediminis TaxID=665099 RepID=UPI002079C744|nr:winged helix-turn-helix domain-containing protein [Cytobacillus oceanisediminis]USK45276.1 winged helix-turn-helix domain-containing protein [Cytobacillus oceanisediminis]
MDLIKKTMEINLEQQKLISSPLRIKIIYLLAKKAMTAKQVAEELGKSAGSIHYHIQQLYKGEILEIEETKENRGIIEKYYRSKATQFNLKEEKGQEKGSSRSMGISISLTDDELKNFQDDLYDLMVKYMEKSVMGAIKRNSYEISCSFKLLNSEEED